MASTQSHSTEELDDMEVCLEDSMTWTSNSSSDVEFCDAEHDLYQLHIDENTAKGFPKSVVGSMNSTSLVPEATTQDVIWSGEAIAAPQNQPLTERMKFEKLNYGDKHLNMKFYMPLGTITFVTVPGSQPLPPKKWRESTYPPAYMPDGHPMFWPLVRLLSISLIRIFTGRNKTSDSLATIRVWVLPDDVALSLLPKSSRQKYRSALKDLMDSLDVSSRGWDSCASLDPIERGYGSESAEDDSLFYIFNTLKSPCPSSVGIEDSYAKLAIDGLIQGELVIPGLKTKLYPYQSRSAAMMIQREVKPGRMLDPRVETMTSPVGTVFYYDREASTLLSERREYDEARGGILAETMGYGKTLICLAAILQTKGHWPCIPPQFSEGVHPVRTNVGTLMDMAAATIGRTQIPWKAYFDQLSRDGEDFQNCVQSLNTNSGSYVIHEETQNNNKKLSVRNAQPKKELIRLCSTTLIITPPNLISQWCREINLHLEQGSLSLLVIDGLYQMIPPATELQKYDVILISKPRFERESASHAVAQQSRIKKHPCQCPYSRCHCPTWTYQSPLSELHFLRLIVDEGHNFVSSGSTSNAGDVVKHLRVDRKWIVSGTPASSLIGVEVDLAANETLDDISGLEDDASRRTLTARRKEIAVVQERKDIVKLGHIVVDFLDLKPWTIGKATADTASWSKYVLPSKTGMRKVTSLRTTLESLVVRHRIEDIERDLTLPPLFNRVVYIEPGFFDKLSINLFLVTLTANAITSERTDQDYMFHPRNRKQLDQLVRNLRQSGFYWTGFLPRDIAETVRVSSEYLINSEKKLSHEDYAKLDRAIAIANLSLSSPAWKAFSMHSEMGLFVENFPTEASYGWSLCPDGNPNWLLIGATQLQEAQKHVRAKLYEADPSQGLLAAGLTAMRKLRNEAQRKQITSPTKNAELAYSRLRSKARRAVPESTIIGVSVVHDKNATPQVLGCPDTVAATMPKSQHIEPNGLKSAMKSTSHYKSPNQSAFALESPVAQTRLIGTASAKLSYLLDQVAILHQKEKIIIFYEGDHVAWYIAQCLELIKVQHLIYAKGTSLKLRSAYMETFNTIETFRVLLMDLRQAAHGLHVASASRIFFVNPVWQPNIEAQAIKRAHRIGQPLPVYVETLVLKDTLEEQLLRRRKAMSNEEHLKAAKSPLDDSEMNAMIRNAAFIPFHNWEKNDKRRQMVPLRFPHHIFEYGVDISATGTRRLSADMQQRPRYTRQAILVEKSKATFDIKEAVLESAVKDSIAHVGVDVGTLSSTEIPFLPSSTSKTTEPNSRVRAHFGIGYPNVPSPHSHVSHQGNPQSIASSNVGREAHKTKRKAIFADELDIDLGSVEAATKRREVAGLTHNLSERPQLTTTGPPQIYGLNLAHVDHGRPLMMSDNRVQRPASALPFPINTKVGGPGGQAIGFSVGKAIPTPESLIQ